MLQAARLITQIVNQASTLLRLARMSGRSKQPLVAARQCHAHRRQARMRRSHGATAGEDCVEGDSCQRFVVCVVYTSVLPLLLLCVS